MEKLKTELDNKFSSAYAIETGIKLQQMLDNAFISKKLKHSKKLQEDFKSLSDKDKKTCMLNYYRNLPFFLKEREIKELIEFRNFSLKRIFMMKVEQQAEAIKKLKEAKNSGDIDKEREIINTYRSDFFNV